MAESIKRAIAAGLVAGIIFPWANAVLAGSAERCEARKLKHAGQYAACRMNAEAKARTHGTAPDFSRCEKSFQRWWDRAEAAGGAACVTLGDLAAIRDQIIGRTRMVVAALDGAPLPECGDGVRNGSDQCEGSDLGGATCLALGFTAGGTLGCTAACQYDVSGCRAQAVPATGQTACYQPGDDGDVQAGASLTYTDNGDGTVTDENTALMWEKKDADPAGLHNRDDRFTWDEAFAFVNTLNGTCANDETITCNQDADCIAAGGSCGFAGYRDWRLPNVKELQSIVDYEQAVPPKVDAALNHDCTPGCTVNACSCTMPSFYWSATTVADYTPAAWFVGFRYGSVNNDGKEEAIYVRAVRAAAQ